MRLRSLVPVAVILATGCYSPVIENPTDGGAGGGSAGGGTGGSSAGGGTGGSSAGGGTGGSSAGGGAGGGLSDGGTGGGSGGGAATGGGAGGGSGDGGMPCGCKNLLGCQVGDSPAACGSAGGTCVTCNLGEQCVNGTCTVGACGPTSCNGCCAMNFCVTPSTQNAFACGKSGAPCIGCSGGNTCQNGACAAPPPCNATTCATGCCFMNTCVTQTNRFACGTMGAACMQCPAMNTCSAAGACVFQDAGTPMNPDAGAPVPVGAPCMSPQQCRPPMNAQCVQETQFGQNTGYPGGYCTAQCSATTPCASGECITENVFGFMQSTCRAACTGTGQGSCRAGYLCTPNAATGNSYCRPNCNNGGLAACGTGTTCGDAGYCQ